MKANEVNHLLKRTACRSIFAQANDMKHFRFFAALRMTKGKESGQLG